MPEATLTLAGQSELVVRMALISYQGFLRKLKRGMEGVGADTKNVDELSLASTDILEQLGWKPTEKRKAEVVRDPAQLDLTSPPADPAKSAPADDGEPKTFDVTC